MNEIIPMNDYLLVEMKEEKTNGLYMGEDKNKAKEGVILAFSKECKNKNLEIGKTVVLNKYEYIPNGNVENQFFVSEKAVIAMK